MREPLGRVDEQLARDEGVDRRVDDRREVERAQGLVALGVGEIGRCRRRLRLRFRGRRRREQRARALGEQRARARRVPVVGHRGDAVQHARLRALGIVERDAALARDRVRALEADAGDLEREAIRRAPHDVDRVVAVASADAHGERLRDVEAGEHEHQLAHGALRAPLRRDLARLRLAEPHDLGEPLGRVVEDVERARAEAVDDAVGGLRADPLDRAAREVATDPGGARGRRGGDHAGLQLRPVARVLLARADHANVLAAADLRHLADHRDDAVRPDEARAREVEQPSGRRAGARRRVGAHAHDVEPGGLVGVGDALDRPLEDDRVGLRARTAHAPSAGVPSSFSRAGAGSSEASA